VNLDEAGEAEKINPEVDRSSDCELRRWRPVAKFEVV